MPSSPSRFVVASMISGQTILKRRITDSALSGPPGPPIPQTERKSGEAVTLKKKLLLGAVLIGAVASAAGPVLAHREAPEGTSWRPVTYGLTETPADLLPASVSSARPVRVISTALDEA